MEILVTGLKADKNGEAGLLLPVPIGFENLTLYVQWAAKDAKANPMQLAWSDGLAITVQKPPK